VTISLLHVSLVVCPIDLVISERWGMSFFLFGLELFFFFFFLVTFGNVASKNITGDKQMYSNAGMDCCLPFFDIVGVNYDAILLLSP
jgi:hypothetical protein